MTARPTRRGFLRTAATGPVALGLGDIGGLLPAIRAEDAKVTPKNVRFDAHIEPLVQRMEETPRDRCVAMVLEQLRSGLPYRRLVAALFLTTIRKGNSHHEVYAIHSAHQMSLDAEPQDRLLPLFWALDSYKRAQERFPAPALMELSGPLPPAAKAADEFEEAMAQFDRRRSEQAVVALLRDHGAQRTMQRLWHYAVRDWGFIGHKAIAAANCWRTLQTIGLQHAETALRFVVSQLYSPYSPSDLKDVQRQCYFANLQRVERGFARLAPNWAAATSDSRATLELLSTMREGKVDPACAAANRLLTDENLPAGTIWDAVHLSAGEHMIGSVDNRLRTRPLHAVTTANAMRYAFRVSSDDRTRMLILLQAVGWITEALRATRAREMLRERRITDIAPAEIPDSPQEAVSEIFDELSSEAPFPSGNERGSNPSDQAGRDAATPMAFAYAMRHADSPLFQQTARRLLFRKASYNAHNYKFAAAVFEDYHLVSPTWRPHMLATSVQWLYGTNSADSPVIKAARDALGAGS